MKSAALVVPKYLQGNNIFNADSKNNRDDIFSPFIQLKKEFAKYGVELNTSDITAVCNASLVLYYNMPRRKLTPCEWQKSFLILSESHVIRKDNYDFARHSEFNKVFTWHDGLVDGVKYHKLSYSHKFPSQVKRALRRKLCVLIAANKKSKHQLELYSERVRAIKWFEENHPDDFDLYGVGWNRYKFDGSRPVRALNKLPFLPEVVAKCCGQRFNSYKGVVSDKKEVMAQYYFSICYENAKDIPGYITEKLFDSFFAGCVPIYWGANNVLDYVPENCFVDKRKFASYSELYKYISTIRESEFVDYLDNIDSYIASNRKYQFSDKYFAEQICSVIISKCLENDVESVKS